ncbi:iron-sulfur cluster carrier protein [Abditibacteriota bacterium]|nr:iron-sulfur cluster carrier protein [Abditibacteriota bacterium]
MNSEDFDGTVDKDAILRALNMINDPDLGRSIVELGFVKNLRACGGNVAFDIELTTPACPVKDQMHEQAIDLVKQIEGVQNVAVNMTSRTRQLVDIRGGIPGVKNTIAVAAGKGGVGKSTTAVNLALALADSGAKVGLLDADIHGPSIPIMLGVPAGEMPDGEEEDGVQKIYPLDRFGIKLMSVGFLTDRDSPIIWRGPMVGKMLTTFLQSVVWGDLDYLIIDLPPGTGDVQLTLIQTAPLSGAVIVTTPEAVAGEDVIRAGKMFEKMGQTLNVNVPILGIVENMSWFESPDGQRHYIFGEGGGQRIAGVFGVPLLGQVPREPNITRGGDSGIPVLVSQPNSPTSALYREIAGGVARRVSTLAMEESAV